MYTLLLKVGTDAVTLHDGAESCRQPAINLSIVASSELCLVIRWDSGTGALHHTKGRVSAERLFPLQCPDEVQPAEPAMTATPHRRWYQFSLRALMVLVVVVAVACGCLKWKVDRQQKRWSPTFRRSSTAA